MKLKIIRTSDETYISYVKRVVTAVRNGTIDYVDMGNCLLGDKNTYSSENLRKAYYILNKIIDKLEDDINLTDLDIKESIEKEKNELFKELVKVRDQKRQLRKDLYTYARYENLEKTLVEAIASLPERH